MCEFNFFDVDVDVDNDLSTAFHLIGLLKSGKNNRRNAEISAKLDKILHRLEAEDRLPQCPACFGGVNPGARICQHCRTEIMFIEGIICEPSQETALRAELQRRRNEEAFREQQERESQRLDVERKEKRIKQKAQEKHLKGRHRESVKTIKRQFKNGQTNGAVIVKNVGHQLVRKDGTTWQAAQVDETIKRYHGERQLKAILAVLAGIVAFIMLMFATFNWLSPNGSRGKFDYFPVVDLVNNLVDEANIGYAKKQNTQLTKIDEKQDGAKIAITLDFARSGDSIGTLRIEFANTASRDKWELASIGDVSGSIVMDRFKQELKYRLASLFSEEEPRK